MTITCMSLTRCGCWTSMPRGRSTTVHSNAERISSCNWKKAAPSVISGWLIGASADSTASFSDAFTMARSMNSPSIRSGFSNASRNPVLGSRSSASATVPNWRSRSINPTVFFIS